MHWLKVNLEISPVIILLYLSKIGTLLKSEKEDGGWGRAYEQTKLKRGHTYEPTNEHWWGTYLRMNEYVFVDTKHQSPEYSFISIEDWNYLLRHDLLKCYKFFLWHEFFYL